MGCRARRFVEHHGNVAPPVLHTELVEVAGHRACKTLGGVDTCVVNAAGFFTELADEGRELLVQLRETSFTLAQCLDLGLQPGPELGELSRIDSVLTREVVDDGHPTLHAVERQWVDFDPLRVLAKLGCGFG